jgi:muramoyltetrapeptide carboxypeptidase
MRVAVLAPSCPLDPAIPHRIEALATAHSKGHAPELVWHPQCFLSHGHFAGDDPARLAALVEAANDPAIDAIWFARGGYGAARIAVAALDRFGPEARNKTYLGYSDAGFLLAGLNARGIGRQVHAPMPADIKRDGGEAEILRVLDWLANPLPAPQPQMAFNMTVLSHLLGTPLEPDFAGKRLLIEEVDEHHYRIDRLSFHITSQPAVRKAAGILLGRCAPIPVNDRPFLCDPGAGEWPDEERIVRYWCDTSGIPFLGRADIGHDAANQLVVFG